MVRNMSLTGDSPCRLEYNIEQAEGMWEYYLPQGGLVNPP